MQNLCFRHVSIGHAMKRHRNLLRHDRWQRLIAETDAVESSVNFQCAEIVWPIEHNQYKFHAYLKNIVFHVKSDLQVELVNNVGSIENEIEREAVGMLVVVWINMEEGDILVRLIPLLLIDCIDVSRTNICIIQ